MDHSRCILCLHLGDTHQATTLWCVEGLYLWNSVNDTCGYRALTSVLVFLFSPPAANIQTCWDPWENHFAKKREGGREHDESYVYMQASVQERSVCH